MGNAVLSGMGVSPRSDMGILPMRVKRDSRRPLDGLNGLRGGATMALPRTGPTPVSRPESEGRMP